jgi:8-amino-7-oxononanoate synthase
MQRVETPSAANMVIDGRPILSFGGSCYLGLSNHPDIIEAGVAALRAYGSTAQLPRHYDFGLVANLEAEAAARDFFDAEGAIYQTSGYLFGIVALPALADDYDVAVLDESAHFNLVEGARAAERPIERFRHRDPEDLERVLRLVTARGQRPLVATDGMFPTFGTLPPLADYQTLIDRSGGWLLVDESHAFGTLGPLGRGSAEAQGISGDRVLRGGSMGKAFCAFGGLSLGRQDAIDRLWLAPASRGAVSGMSSGAAMTAASLRIVRDNPDLLARLRSNTVLMRTMLERLGVVVEPSQSPVAAFVHGSADQMRSIQRQLWDDGIYVIYSTYVGAGPEGALRIAAFADHTPEDYDRLEDALKRLL